MLQLLMVFWFPSAKQGRNLIQSLHCVFWVDMSLFCPRIRAAILAAMLVQGRSWLQLVPRWALQLWLFQEDMWRCGTSSLSATVHALHPPLLSMACVMVESAASQWGLPKTSACPGIFTSAWCCVCSVAWVPIGLDAQNPNPFQTRIYGWKIHSREILSLFTLREEF